MLKYTQNLLKNWEKSRKHMVVNSGVVNELEGVDKKSGHYVRVLMVKGYPPLILSGYLDQLDHMISAKGATLRKTIRYIASDIKWNNSMKNKLRRLERSIDAQSITDPARQAEVAARDTILALRDSNLSDGRKLVDVFTFLTIAAPKQHILDDAVASVKQWFVHMDGSLDELELEQPEAMRQTAPLADPQTASSEFFMKHHYGQVTTDYVAARTYPMTRGSFSDEEGLYFGVRVEDGSFCFINLCDPNDPRAQNITVLGKTGQGKSFFLKALVVSLLEEGVHVFVFDLDGEWRDLCEEIGGTYIDQTGEEGRYFEPLRVMPAIPEIDRECAIYNRRRLRRSIDSCVRTYSLLAGKMDKPELYEVGEAIRRVHKKANVDRKDPSTWEGPFTEETRPTIHKVFSELEDEALNKENPHAKSVYDRVKLYFTGIYDDFFQTEEDTLFHETPFVVYKVGDGQKDGDDDSDVLAQQAQIKMSMAFEIVNSNVQKNRFEGKRFSAVLVDEGQRQTQNPQMRRGVFDWYTSIRKWNGMMILASNSPAILLDNPQGTSVWENTNVRVYFFMEQSAVRTLNTNSDLPIEIQHQIKFNEDSNTYVLEYHKKYDLLKMVVPPEEAALYKTRGLKNTG